MGVEQRERKKERSRTHAVPETLEKKQELCKLEVSTPEKDTCPKDALKGKEVAS